MNRRTAPRPMAKANSDLSLESWPSVGPTVRVSMMLTLTGSAPLRRTTARFCASSSVFWPEISALPPRIGSRTFGAVSTSPSSRMAIVRPTFFVVRSANFFAPSSVNSRLTTFWPFCWFVAACASLRSVPVSTVLPSSSLNSSMAVLPMVLMAASGSLTPGSSMMTRRSPSRWMIGSVRPSALTRFSMMVTTRFIASSLTFATSVSSASSTTA